jgi:hypothetical protein
MRLQTVIAMALAILRVSAFSNPTIEEDTTITDAYMDKCLEDASFNCVYDALKAVDLAHLPSGQPAEDEDAVSKVHLQARGAMVPPTTEIDLHSIDSRCNPVNMSEVQRFDGKEWIHHFTCMHPNLCKDVNGIGACQVAPGVYLFKAANDTTIFDPIDKAPVLTAKKCNPKNGSEALAWNGTHWEFDGVCLPPYICHDFEGAAGFVFCSAPEAAKNRVNGASKKLNQRWYVWDTSSSSSSDPDDSCRVKRPAWFYLLMPVIATVVALICMGCGAYWA